MAKRVSRTWSIAYAFAVVVLAFGVTTANAHESSIATDLFIDDVRFTHGQISAVGHLTSPNEGCLPGRTVRLFAVDDSGTPSDESDDVRTLLDTDRTSLNGAYYLEGNFPGGTDYWSVRVARKNIGPSGHKHICQSASADFSLT